jgi:hypothetical protein
VEIGGGKGEEVDWEGTGGVGGGRGEGGVGAHTCTEPRPWTPRRTDADPTVVEGGLSEAR